MNPTTNVMSQDSGRSIRPQPKRLRGTSERIFTAVVQLVCGIIAVACGLALVVLKTPYNDNYYGYQITRIGKTAFGIWGGLIFIATAIPYFFGRHRKSMVGLYFGFCLASAVIAVVGLGLSITAINKIVYTTSGTLICNDEALGIQRDQKYRCCFDEYRYRYDCRPSYNHRFSWYDYHLPATYGYQRLNYNSLECESFRSYLRDSYKQCVQEIDLIKTIHHNALQRFTNFTSFVQLVLNTVKRVNMPHLAFYGIMVAVVSVELFASVFGACAALSALCNCCVGGKPTQYYPCSFNQLMVNDSLNNTVIPPQVTTQQRGPTVISTTQVPQTFNPLQVPPQTVPLGY
ncbi:hypothetical protein HOLleu_40923 [Holothuria leucospilota]|uniref:Uncharacterized protein n=1 Tax=Holothuria leucospilota TaxID=206669 RepID=A0A9Q1BDF4_HOLLE|nr:hypothetical protein HOLleu_40923 [Holothuria leucospilota]